MTKLETITAEDLQNRTYEPTHFLVDELIPEGLHILAGAPKIGKSWLALWLCLCISQGQPLWNFATTQGEALYLSLEDSFQRIQTRLFDLTEDAPPTLHFAIMADTLKHGLEQQIEQFLTEHPATKLVVIDTLQRVRSAGGDSNLYANDYCSGRRGLQQHQKHAGRVPTGSECDAGDNFGKIRENLQRNSCRLIEQIHGAGYSHPRWIPSVNRSRLRTIKYEV